MRETTVTTTTVDMTTVSVRYDANDPESFYPTLPPRDAYVAPPAPFNASPETSHDAAMINEHGAE